MESLIEKGKPFLLTISPAVGGNCLGLVVGTGTPPLIELLQLLAYLVSIAIGLLQLYKFFRDQRLQLGRLSARLWRRYWSPSSRLWRAVGDLALVLIPVLECTTFSDPVLNDRKEVVYLALVAVKLLSNLSKANPKSNANIQQP